MSQWIRAEDLDKREYENLKNIARKTSPNFEKWLKGTEEFRKILLENKRNLNKKYREMLVQEHKIQIQNQPETMKQRIEILKQYPYVDKYFEDLNKYLTKWHTFIPFCEMIVSDEFKVFKFETSKKEPIVVLSGWYMAARDKSYHHIKALCILPKNHKLIANEFVKIVKETKATEVKVVNEDKIITYHEPIKGVILKNIDSTGSRSNYGLNISRI